MAIEIGPPPRQNTKFDEVWRTWISRWFAASGGTANAGSFNGLNFTASNITSILTRNHNNLQTIGGGASNNYFHITSAQHAILVGAVLPHFTPVDSISAGQTQTQAGATALTSGVNRVTVSAVDLDGVKLPTAFAGARCLIINADAAQTIQIWPNTGDAIDGGSANAVDSNSLAAGASREYVAIDVTNWYTI
jgi:hypothetical protein|tara:strand:- start:383 stop:958 length:576 start_codon:yes stop_codon:yes gene_type:complete